MTKAPITVYQTRPTWTGPELLRLHLQELHIPKGPNTYKVQHRLIPVHTLAR